MKINELKKIGLKFAKKDITPCYLYDRKEAEANLAAIKNSFKKNGVDVSIYFAVKSNFYDGLLRTVVKNGHGLDVSSQRELKLALAAGAKKIVYTGPAKSEQDFKLIRKHVDKITLNIDSFNELNVISKVLKGKKIKAGVRIYTVNQNEVGWTKFGIPLPTLRKFYDLAKKNKSLDFCGIHFHISMNKHPTKYVETLKELGAYLKKNFNEKELESFEFIDIGGGIYPQTLEGVYKFNPNQELKYFNPDFDYDRVLRDEYKPRYTPILAEPIGNFARDISKAWKKYILPVVPEVKMYAEPGRFVSHSCLHILLRVIDIKNNKRAIIDGGNNVIGWEKYQYFYYSPVYNLTHFNPKKEQPYILYGSLCTPDDIWGYYYFGNDMKIGDVLMLPYQGCYSYATSCDFIRGMPKVYDI